MSGSSGSQSSGESDTERHSSKKTVKKIESVDNKGDLEKIRLSRFKLDKFVHLPIFKKTVVGCFVRINIGNHPEKGAMYRIAEILDVCETAKVYDVMKNRTNIGLKVRHGKHARVFRAQFVSNQHFEDSEFVRPKTIPTYIHQRKHLGGRKTWTFWGVRLSKSVCRKI